MDAPRCPTKSVGDETVKIVFSGSHHVPRSSHGHATSHGHVNSHGHDSPLGRSCQTENHKLARHTPDRGRAEGGDCKSLKIRPRVLREVRAPVSSGTRGGNNYQLFLFFAARREEEIRSGRERQALPGTTRSRALVANPRRPKVRRARNGVQGPRGTLTFRRRQRESSERGLRMHRCRVRNPGSRRCRMRRRWPKR